MALIKTYPDTVAGKQEKMRARLSQVLQSQFDSIKSVVEHGRTNIWSNPDGLTPQEAFDAFGTDGYQLLKASMAAINMLNAIVPGTADASLPDGHTVQVNADGSITVTA
jgi:hypothetical protein